MKVKLKMITVCCDNITAYDNVATPEKFGERAKAVFSTLDPLQEHILAVFVNDRNTELGNYIVSSGCTNQSMIDFKLLIRAALLTPGPVTGILLAHNHPSGDPYPSMQDISMTEEFLKVCKLMQFRGLDHIILGDYNYSMRSHGHCNFK